MWMISAVSRMVAHPATTEVKTAMAAMGLLQASKDG
jgi:hypothetical protein